METIRIKLAKEANDYVLLHGTKEQIDIWHTWWPEEPDEKDYLFIAEMPEHWKYFWTLFGELFV